MKVSELAQMLAGLRQDATVLVDSCSGCGNVAQLVVVEGEHPASYVEDDGELTVTIGRASCGYDTGHVAYDKPQPEPIPMAWVQKPEGDHIVRWAGDGS